jgi:3-hydroxybutyrate dehydrogenase
MDDLTFKGKVVVVTGSTSGIGLGIARCFAKRGGSIMLNGFGDGDAIAKDLGNEFGVKTSFHGANLMNADECVDLIQKTHELFGSVDVLINNAGIQYVAPVQDFPVEKWDQILALNLTSAFHTIRTAIPFMQAQQFGRIINVASAHGLVGSKGKAAYVAAKHGILGLTKVVGLENAGTGITCNAICPGWVLTPLVQKQIDDNAAKAEISIKEAERELLSEKQPSHQFATPEEVGELAVFLASLSAAQITGSHYSIDGGWTAQ